MMLTKKLTSLSARIEEFLLKRGAVKVGFANIETLEGGPPSVDLSYRLPGARSAISFALTLDRSKMRSFLSKKDRIPHEEDNMRTQKLSRDLSWEVAGILQEEGHEAKGTAANLKYRKELKNWEAIQPPDISHRYVAVASGVGSFGWSGNVGLDEYGSGIILGTCVTTADLEPTNRIPEGQGFCDSCKLCVASCPVDMFKRDEETSVMIAGETYSHSDRNSYLRCLMCCGGVTGTNKTKKWSSWSPGRFDIPEDDDELKKELDRARALQNQRPPMNGGTIVADRTGRPVQPERRAYTTCGNCQLICWGNKKETAQNIRMLHDSGCVIQDSDGSVRALPPKEAEREFQKMHSDHRGLYT